MNIGELFICSCCLEKLEEEGDCPVCGYEAGKNSYIQALEEGTLIGNGTYQLGAVVRQGEEFFLYGAWELKGNRAVFVKEYFPERIAERSGDDVRVKKACMKEEFECGINLYGEPENDIRIDAGNKKLGYAHELVWENGTVYKVIVPF